MSRQGVVLSIVAAFALSAKAACPQEPAELFRSLPGLMTVYECGSGHESSLCDQPIRETCQRVNLGQGLKLLSSLKATGPQEKILAAYLSAMRFSEPVHLQPILSIQTGKYAQIMASQQALNSKCMTVIVQAAYKLHTHFPDYNFVLDSRIQNCQNLRDGIRQLLADTAKVKQNLDRFHTPLHSIYLSNKSGFNHNDLGKMGLYINVDQSGEIRRLLIDAGVKSGVSS